MSGGTYQTATEWKELWWTHSRSDVKQAYLKLAPVGVAQPQLLTCQSDFETSDCAAGVHAALAKFEDKTLELFCGFTNDLNETKLKLVRVSLRPQDKRMIAMVDAYQEHMNKGSCAKYAKK